MEWLPLKLEWLQPKLNKRRSRNLHLGHDDPRLLWCWYRRRNHSTPLRL